MGRKKTAVPVNVKLIKAWMKKNGINKRALSIDMGLGSTYLNVVLSRGLMGLSSLTLFTMFCGISEEDLTNLDLTDADIERIIHTQPVSKRNDWLSEKQMEDNRNYNENCEIPVEEAMEKFGAVEVTEPVVKKEPKPITNEAIFTALLGKISGLQVTLTVGDIVELIKECVE